MNTKKYITLDEALEVLDRQSCYWAAEYMKLIPAADVREVKRGRWINQEADSEMCSACGSRFYISALFAVGINDEPNFCPNCGANMTE